MVQKNLNLNDQRNIRTREAIIGAFFYFYATHPRCDRLSVRALCCLAGVSTPTFYRHFRNLFGAAELGHKTIQLELTSIVDGNATLFVSLVQLFYFVVNHKDYYLANLHQMYALPFEEIRLILEPMILAHIQKRASCPNELAEWLCYETGNYATLVVRWWINKEVCDTEKIDQYARQIIVYANQRVAEADRQMRMSARGRKNN